MDEITAVAPAAEVLGLLTLGALSFSGAMVGAYCHLFSQKSHEIDLFCLWLDV